MKKPKNSTKVTIDGTTAVNKMDLYSLCRWASLKDAIDIIGEKCDEKSIDFNDVELSPFDLIKYVDSMTDDLFYKISQQKDTLS